MGEVPAADARLLFEHGYFQPGLGQQHGGRQTARTGADNQDALRHGLVISSNEDAKQAHLTTWTANSPRMVHRLFKWNRVCPSIAPPRQALSHFRLPIPATGPSTASRLPGRRRSSRTCPGSNVHADESAVAEGERSSEMVLPHGGGRAAPPPFRRRPPLPSRRLHCGRQRLRLAWPAVVETPSGGRPVVERRPERQVLIPWRVGAALMREHGVARQPEFGASPGTASPGTGG